MTCINASRIPLRDQHLDARLPRPRAGIRKGVAALIRASIPRNAPDIYQCRIRLRQGSFDVDVGSYPDVRRAAKASRARAFGRPWTA